MKAPYLSVVWTIAKNTYKEIIRDRLLYGILVVALLITASTFFLATISLDQNGRVLENLGPAFIQVFAALICIFVATTSMSKDEERRALYLLFSKPISRSQYILGKFVGMVLLLLTTLLILGGLFILGLAFIERGIIANVVIDLCFTFLEVSLLSALAILFASFASSLNATLYSIALFVIGHSLGALKDYASTLGNQVAFDLLKVCYYLLPNLEKFDMRRSLLYGLALPKDAVAWSLVYWVVYTGLLLFLAMQVMRQREV